MAARLMFVLLFVGWVGEWPLEIDTAMFSGLWRSPFVVFGPLFTPVPGIRLMPWQLLLIALAPICLATPGGFRHRAREMDAAILASVASIAITFLWGWLRGGAPYQAYFQLWRFLTGLLVAFLLMSAIRTPRDLRVLASAIVAAALIRGTLVIYFYWVHVSGKINPVPEYMTNHDDSLLFVTALLIAWSWAILRNVRAAWIVAILVSAYLFYAMVLNDRRIAWVELVMALLANYFLIGAGPLRRRINRWMIFAAPLVILYVIAGWGREGAIFAPVQALSSTGSDHDQSSLARQEEVRNLLYTMSVSGNFLLGTGWGVPYQKLTSIYANYSEAWTLALYTPHNSLLGLALFSGLVGILGIWGVVPMAAYLLTRGYMRSTDPVQRAAAMVAAGILAAYSVHCFGDIGFQSFPCGLFLGVALATAGNLAVWSRAHDRTRAPRVPAASLAGMRTALPASPAASKKRMESGSHPLQGALKAAHGLAPLARQAPKPRSGSQRR